MITLIAAIDQLGGISKNDVIPWHLPDDLKNFKKVTMGHAVLMGRKTWESLPKDKRPLPGRKNIVVSRHLLYDSSGSAEIRETEDGSTISIPSEYWYSPTMFSFTLEKYRGDTFSQLFIIGGADIFQQTIGIADKLIITRVDHTFGCDRFFPETPFEKWSMARTMMHDADEKHAYPFTICTYVRRG